MTVSFGSDFPTITLTVNFSGSTWTDLSAYIRSIDIDRPSSEETGRFPVGTMTVVLDNRDGRFTPANTSGPYTAAGVTQVLPEIGVRLKATWASTDHNLFAGIVENWQDEFPMHGHDAVTVLTVVDYLAEIAAWEGDGTVTAAAGEDLLDRISTIADAAGNSSTVSAAGSGDETLQAQVLAGNGLDLMHLAVDSEGGALYYSPRATGSDGAIHIVSRSGRVSLAAYSTVQTTFSAAGVPFRDPVVSSGRERILRQASLAAVGGTVQTSGSGNPAVYREDLLTERETGVKAIADLLVAVGDPADNYRIREITVLPVNGETWADVLDLDMVHLCEVELDPPVSGVTITRQVFVDGIRHSIRPRDWSITFTFQSAVAWTSKNFATWDSGVWDTAVWFF